MKLHSALLGAALALSAIAPMQALAQDYPAKPVRVIVPFPPGGISDVLARALSTELGKQLGQPFIVENKSGAGGNIGNAQVASAPPDGYTLAVALDTSITLNPLIYPSIGFDPMTRLVPITMASDMPMVLVVRADSKVKTLRDLVAMGQKSSQALAFPSGGPGSPSNVLNRLLEKEAKFNILDVAYTGNPPQIMSVLSGETQAGFAATAGVIGHIQSGKMTALAIAANTRYDLLPKIPTMAEAGVPGVDTQNWQVVLAPAGTPKKIVDTLNRHINQIIETHEFQRTVRDLGMTPLGKASPESTANRLRQEHEKWKSFVRSTRIDVN